MKDITVSYWKVGLSIIGLMQSIIPNQNII